MSFWSLYYHLIWATKNREPWLTAEVENFLYPYLVSKSAETGAYIYAIDGWHDHIHLVVAVPPTIAVAAFVKRLKGASSHELNRIGLASGQFAWQHGYGALSLGARQRADAEAYVRNQKTHHAAQTANPWLERSAEHDEGPQDHGLTPAQAVRPVREEPESYAVSIELPF